MGGGGEYGVLFWLYSMETPVRNCHCACGWYTEYCAWILFSRNPSLKRLYHERDLDKNKVQVLSNDPIICFFSLSGRPLYEDNRNTGYISHKSEFFLTSLCVLNCTWTFFMSRWCLLEQCPERDSLSLLFLRYSLFCVSMNFLHATSPKNNYVLYQEMANFLHKTMGGGGGGEIIHGEVVTALQPWIVLFLLQI